MDQTTKIFIEDYNLSHLFTNLEQIDLDHTLCAGTTRWHAGHQKSYNLTSLLETKLMRKRRKISLWKTVSRFDLTLRLMHRTANLAPIEDSLRIISQTLDEVEKTQQYLRVREQKHRDSMLVS